MAEIDYEFDQGGAGKSRTGIYVRLGVIFLLVAGLTAGIIWALIPRAEEEKPVPLPLPPLLMGALGGHADGAGHVRGDVEALGEGDVPVDLAAAPAHLEEPHQRVAARAVGVRREVPLQHAPQHRHRHARTQTMGQSTAPPPRAAHRLGPPPWPFGAIFTLGKTFGRSTVSSS